MAPRKQGIAAKAETKAKAAPKKASAANKTVKKKSTTTANPTKKDSKGYRSRSNAYANSFRKVLVDWMRHNYPDEARKEEAWPSEEGKRRPKGGVKGSDEPPEPTMVQYLGWLDSLENRKEANVNNTSTLRYWKKFCEESSNKKMVASWMQFARASRTVDGYHKFHPNRKNVEFPITGRGTLHPLVSFPSSTDFKKLTKDLPSEDESSEEDEPESEAETATKKKKAPAKASKKGEAQKKAPKEKKKASGTASEKKKAPVAASKKRTAQATAPQDDKAPATGSKGESAKAGPKRVPIVAFLEDNGFVPVGQLGKRKAKPLKDSGILFSAEQLEQRLARTRPFRPRVNDITKYYRVDKRLKRRSNFSLLPGQKRFNPNKKRMLIHRASAPPADPLDFSKPAVEVLKSGYYDDGLHSGVRRADSEPLVDFATNDWHFDEDGNWTCGPVPELPPIQNVSSGRSLPPPAAPSSSEGSSSDGSDDDDEMDARAAEVVYVTSDDESDEGPDGFNGGEENFIEEDYDEEEH